PEPREVCWGTDTDADPTSQPVLHEVLIPRIELLRTYVQKKVPRRFRHVISADDVLQEVWIAAQRTVSAFEPRGSNAIDRWLQTIAKSKLIDALRTAQRLKRGGDRCLVRDAKARLTSLSSLFARLQTSQRTPSKEFQTSEAAHTLRILLNMLNAASRTAIELRYVNDLSHAEIAREMGRSEAAVNSLLYRGRRDLRELLGSASRYFSDTRSSEHGPAGKPDESEK
ncbi:unnamed protein product, partial [marine sediment metagenome]